jgi:hypothetical protein
MNCAYLFTVPVAAMDFLKGISTVERRAGDHDAGSLQNIITFGSLATFPLCQQFPGDMIPIPITSLFAWRGIS